MTASDDMACVATAAVSDDMADVTAAVKVAARGAAATATADVLGGGAVVTATTGDDGEAALAADARPSAVGGLAAAGRGGGGVWAVLASVGGYCWAGRGDPVMSPPSPPPGLPLPRPAAPSRVASVRWPAPTGRRRGRSVAAPRRRQQRRRAVARPRWRLPSSRRRAGVVAGVETMDGGVASPPVGLPATPRISTSPPHSTGEVAGGSSAPTAAAMGNGYGTAAAADGASAVADGPAAVGRSFLGGRGVLLGDRDTVPSRRLPCRRQDGRRQPPRLRRGGPPW